jgi:zinc/manganese transport system substrate-binding protein/manganese/iron transport system substrate-binding protein
MARGIFIPHMSLGLALATVFAVLSVACRGTGSDDGKLHVLTSLALFGDFVQQVGGDRIVVDSLVPVAADPHTFQPSPRDVRKITQAKLIVLNGTALEGAMADTIEKNTPKQAHTVVLSEGLQTIETESDEEPGTYEDNPHFWLNARYAMIYVERIRDGLTAIDPHGAETYRQNADRYLQQLADLDREVETAMTSIPSQRRKLITFHDAYPYFAQRYGLEIVAVAIRSPGREASAQEVAELTREIQRYSVPTVYKEPQFNARILELAARDAGVQVRSLYSDAFSNEVHSYLDIMRYNARQLVEGLK